VPDLHPALVLCDSFEQVGKCGKDARVVSVPYLTGGEKLDLASMPVNACSSVRIQPMEAVLSDGVNTTHIAELVAVYAAQFESLPIVEQVCHMNFCSISFL
jgi:hypothetical protein